MSNEKKYNFLKKKLQTTKANKEVHEEMFRDANSEFSVALDSLIKTLPPEDALVLREKLKINIDNKNRQQEKQDKPEPSKETKDIYRKVANISHPDKTGEEPDLTEKFTKANTAMNSGD